MTVRRLHSKDRQIRSKLFPFCLSLLSVVSASVFCLFVCLSVSPPLLLPSPPFSLLILDARTHARTHALTHARTHARTLARTHAHSLTHSLIHTHTHTHTLTHTHTRTHAHSHTHTHTRLRYLELQLCRKGCIALKRNVTGEEI